jgi:hypothetical protein
MSGRFPLRTANYRRKREHLIKILLLCVGPCDGCPSSEQRRMNTLIILSHITSDSIVRMFRVMFKL